jgi:hypothetical protein
MKPKVYIETTIPSYLAARPSRDLVIAGNQELTEKLLSAGVVPLKAATDAAHIAVAAVHEVDYLLTWNCKHIANAEIMRKIYRLCKAEGFDCPVNLIR